MGNANGNFIYYSAKYIVREFSIYLISLMEGEKKRRYELNMF